VYDKERYDIIKQYKEETSKLSDEIFRDKRPELENGRKMMSRMIHGSLLLEWMSKLWNGWWSVWWNE
jgi:hypothetical protein